MKRLILFLSLFALLSSSCRSGADLTNPESFYLDGFVSHGRIVLGPRLENPYTVQNVRSALNSLYPTKAGHQVQTSDLYVRFLPADDAQLQQLRDMGLLLLDHPMDYSIACEGDYYQDPTLAEDVITWQYSVVPVDFVFPDIRYEVIDECFIATDSNTKASDGIDWDAVEKEAFRQTGNGDMLVSTKAGEEVFAPAGRVTISDDKFNGGQPFGVAQVRVDCNVFVKYASTYSDRDGYYRIPKTFSSNPRYRLVFKNKKGFSIGFNSILYPASVSTLGQGSPAGLSVAVSNASDRSLFRRCAANNAMYDYYERCSSADLGISEPPSNLCLWMFDFLDASSAVMLHHGTVLGEEQTNIYFKIAAFLVRLFSPDITIGTKDVASYSDLYRLVMHELSHASHFSQVGLEYWNKYIMYIVQCVMTGSVYGEATRTDSGYCAVGETWAYYMEDKLFQDRYGASGTTSSGSVYWFRPAILSYLAARGVSPQMMFKALQPSVTSMDAFKSKLIELYPSRRTVINQAFDRYE